MAAAATVVVVAGVAAAAAAAAVLAVAAAELAVAAAATEVAQPVHPIRLLCFRLRLAPVRACWKQNGAFAPPCNCCQLQLLMCYLSPPRPPPLMDTVPWWRSGTLSSRMITPSRS